MAGSPGGIGRPGRVTVPTPSPARKTIAPGAPGAGSTRTRISARCVTSGSSPASLRTAASACPRPTEPSSTANTGRSPRGRVISTSAGTAPVAKPIAAALAAAVAQAPVVQPVRSLRTWSIPALYAAIPRPGKSICPGRAGTAGLRSPAQDRYKALMRALLQPP